MIRIAISQAAYDAIAATIEAGWRLEAPQRLTDGRIHIWLPKGVVHAFTRLRRPGEDYSALIIRITEELA